MTTGIHLMIVGATLLFCGGATAVYGTLETMKDLRRQNIALLLYGQINNSEMKPNELAIPIDDKEFNETLTVYMDGSVKVGEGFTNDEAARIFWKKVQEVAPRS